MIDSRLSTNGNGQRTLPLGNTLAAPAAKELTALFRESYAPLRLLGRSPRTPEIWETMLRRLAEFLQRPAELADLADETIARYLQWMLDAGYARPTVNKDLSRLKALWNHALRKRLVERECQVARLPEIVRVKRAWPIDVVSRILEAASRFRLHAYCHRDTYGGVDVRLWWRAFFLAIYDTGGRVTATLMTPWDRYDPTQRLLVIPGDEQKHRHDEYVTVAPDTAAAIAAMYQPRRERLFPFNARKKTLYRHCGQIMQLAGLPNDALHKFHRLRRTSITYEAITQGMDSAQRKAGHANRATTMFYVDPTMFAERHDASNLPRPVVPEIVVERQLELFE